MKIMLSVSALLAALLVCATPCRAQMAPPQPGPEHDILKHDVGTWDAAMEMFPGGGAPAMTASGTESNTMGCGGLCLVTEFKGELMPGTAFEGRGLTTWDTTKKKYVGTWTDSMTSGIAMMEGTFDPATKTMTAWTDGKDPSGAPMKSKSTTEYQGDDKRVFTVYTTGADGKEAPAMRITYTRRK